MKNVGWGVLLTLVMAVFGGGGPAVAVPDEPVLDEPVLAVQTVKPGMFRAELSGNPGNRNVQAALFQTTYSGRVKWHADKPGRARLVLEGAGRDAEIKLELRTPVMGEAVLYPSGRFTHGRGIGDVRVTARQGRMRFTSRRGEVHFKPAGDGLVRGTFDFVMERPGRYNESYVLRGELLMEEHDFMQTVDSR